MEHWESIKDTCDSMVRCVTVLLFRLFGEKYAGWSLADFDLSHFGYYEAGVTRDGVMANCPGCSLVANLPRLGDFKISLHVDFYGPFDAVCDRVASDLFQDFDKVLQSHPVSA